MLLSWARKENGGVNKKITVCSLGLGKRKIHKGKSWVTILPKEGYLIWFSLVSIVGNILIRFFWQKGFHELVSFP